MRIAILTSGRFHVLDLARELDALGHDVAFWSLVPRRRARRFGLPDRCHRWLAPWVAPALLAWSTGRRFPGAEIRLRRALIGSIDLAASTLIEPCDALIAMSGMSQRTLTTARRRFGASLFLERSSLHIEAQKAILEDGPNRRGSFPQWIVDRELAEYQLADTIVVPSDNVRRSFAIKGIPEERTFLN
ncbi:MAG: glycosyltransferase, partial [Longimicrobiales bacterium]